uniref:Bestrophin homolog n=1 Tax=Gongylonema pulchrum TaxID=637853 RepID=A0A183EB92_9BILA
LISSYVDGDDEETRMMRRAMVRYMCLAQVLVYRDISIPVRKRFPTYTAIVKAGFMTAREMKKLSDIDLEYDKYWVPINWTFTLFHNARRAKKISSDVMTNKLCDELRVFRQSLQVVCNYDWIDLHVPVMTIIQFIFFVGWLKAAEVLLNPMGEDDDDFECNYLIDKNLATALSIVDESKKHTPSIKPDQFLSRGHVDAMYSRCSIDDAVRPLVGSAVHAKFSSDDRNLILPHESMFDGVQIF